MAQRPQSGPAPALLWRPRASLWTSLSCWRGKWQRGVRVPLPSAAPLTRWLQLDGARQHSRRVLGAPEQEA